MEIHINLHRVNMAETLKTPVRRDCLYDPTKPGRDDTWDHNFDVLKYSNSLLIIQNITCFVGIDHIILGNQRMLKQQQ